MSCSQIRSSFYFVALVLIACGEGKAGPSFHQGEQAEAAKDVPAAWKAYEAAVAADKDSALGRRAQERLDALKPQHDAYLAEEAKKEAETERKRAIWQKEAAAEKAAALAKENSCKKWVTFCDTGGGFLPGATKAECEASASGFKKLGVKCASCKCWNEVEGATPPKDD